MKKPISLLLSSLLLAQGSYAGTAEEAGVISDLYSEVIESISVDEKLIQGEVIFKELLVAAIEQAQTLNEDLGIDQIKPGAKYVMLPLTLFGIYGSSYFIGKNPKVQNLFKLDKNMKDFRALTRELKATHTKALAQVAETQKLLKATSPGSAMHTGLSTQLANRNHLALRAQNNFLKLRLVKPGILSRSASLIRNGVRVTALLGGISVLLAVTADAVVLVLPEKVEELLTQLKEDIANGNDFLVALETNHGKNPVNDGWEE